MVLCCWNSDEDEEEEEEEWETYLLITMHDGQTSLIKDWGKQRATKGWSVGTSDGRSSDRFCFDRSWNVPVFQHWLLHQEGNCIAGKEVKRKKKFKMSPPLIFPLVASTPPPPPPPPFPPLAAALTASIFMSPDSVQSHRAVMYKVCWISEVAAGDPLWTRPLLAAAGERMGKRKIPGRMNEWLVGVGCMCVWRMAVGGGDGCDGPNSTAAPLLIHFRT